MKSLKHVPGLAAVLAALQVALSMPGFWHGPLVVMSLQWLAGWVQKRIPNEVWHNRIIPIANYALGFFAWQLVPASAAAAGFSGVAHGIVSMLLHPAVAALLCTVATTGTHSIGKNLQQLLMQTYLAHVQRRAVVVEPKDASPEKRDAA